MSLELTASKDDLQTTFFALRSRKDIAQLLEISDKQLIYHLYIAHPKKSYKRFEIPKKSGGVREILAPVSALKIIRQKLNQVLHCVYKPKPSVHGYVHGRSIVSNAKVHAKRRNLLNIDLLDFFPSINFGRVRGMFMSFPYNRNAVIATVLAQICCVDNQLPQGAPTSPIVSNMICAKMDAQLQQLAKNERCTYTRYADDISFSTTRPELPSTVATIVDESGRVEVGDQLTLTVRNNGFEINENKVRLQRPTGRQEVTGLVTNLFPNVRRQYVRQIRAMLHAWERYGLQAVEKTYREKYAPKHLGPRRRAPSFVKVIQGKIEFLEMVRGRRNPMYLRYREQLWELAPELAKMELTESITPSLPTPQVVTEGKTDWKHLKAALKRLKAMGDDIEELEVHFLEYGDDTPMGDMELLKFCASQSKVLQTQPTICIFDRDNPKILNKVLGKDTAYKEWGNNVFSFAIPVPEHRADAPEVSIESKVYL